MLKLGRLAPCEHVICLSHTLHLVVGDIFYKQNNKKNTTEEEADSSDDDEEETPTKLRRRTRQ